MTLVPSGARDATLGRAAPAVHPRGPTSVPGRARLGVVSSRLLRRLIAAFVVLLVVASVLGAAHEPVRWRVAVLRDVALGRISDLGLAETVRLMFPNGRYYLRGLLDNPSPYVVIRNPFTSPADSSAGQRLFLTRCAICHAEGAHGTAPRLERGVFNRGASDWAVYRNITRGIAGSAMRPQELDEQQAWQVITYVRGVSRGAGSTRPTWNAIPAGSPLEKLRPVDGARLLEAPKAPGDWLTYSGSYASWRYSGLKQLTPATAKRLGVRWIFQTRSTDNKVEVSPLVVDGVMYLTVPPASVSALDAATGRQLWGYVRTVPPDLRLCCGQVNRGVAIAGTTLFMATVDAHLVALDARSGAVLWDVTIADYREGYTATGAPLVVGDRVIVGIGGGEYGIRGFLDAYDLRSGKRLWRFHTVPGPGEPGNQTWAGDSWKRGSAPTWLTGSYDPELKLIYWGVGNPGPNFDGEARLGDNLYSNSVIALDPATGTLRWHFQFTPHDQFDWDAVQVPVLVDREWQGRPRQLMLWANRNGFLYVLDRATGEFLLGKPFVRQTWADSLTRTGVPVRRAGTDPSAGGTPIYPSILGGTNWWSPSYSPITGLFYVPVLEQGGVYHRRSEGYRYKPGELFTGSAHNNLPLEGGWTAIRAFDPLTGERVWDTRMQGGTGLLINGVMATAGGVVVGSDGSDVVVLDAQKGTELWRFNAGGQIWAAPVSYEVAGTQFVTIAAGNSIMAFTLK